MWVLPEPSSSSCQSLTLLEYLLKTGDDRVLLKMKDNIYIVKALTEYRFVEKDGKDQVTPFVPIRLDQNPHTCFA